MRPSRRPEWQLPAGVPRGVWEYAQEEHIAQDYDATFAENDLFQFDKQVLARYFARPGVVVDLGCGTGRALLPLARRGFRAVAVDLSAAMLEIVGAKAEAEGLEIDRLCANLVELDCLADEVADYAVCLFSTLGMIRGRTNRQRVLQHAWRILRPGGLLVIHVHNLWYNLTTAAGRWWLLKHLFETTKADVEWGDRFFDYCGISKMFLHTFPRREFVPSLRKAGFKIREVVPLDSARYRRLPWAWLLGSVRANGWIAVAEKRGSRLLANEAATSARASAVQ